MMLDVIGTMTKIVLIEELIFHLNPSHRLCHFFPLIHASSMIYEYQLHTCTCHPEVDVLCLLMVIGASKVQSGHSTSRRNVMKSAEGFKGNTLEVTVTNAYGMIIWSLT